MLVMYGNTARDVKDLYTRHIDLNFLNFTTGSAMQLWLAKNEPTFDTEHSHLDNLAKSTILQDNSKVWKRATSYFTMNEANLQSRALITLKFPVHAKITYLETEFSFTTGQKSFVIRINEDFLIQYASHNPNGYHAYLDGKNVTSTIPTPSTLTTYSISQVDFSTYPEGPFNLYIHNFYGWKGSEYSGDNFGLRRIRIDYVVP